MVLKKFVISAILASFIGVGAFANSTQANAATWHMGTPKKLRGTWTDKYKVPRGGIYDALYINAHIVNLNERAPYLANVRYERLNHDIYKFYGYDIEAGRHYSLKVHYFNKKHVRTYESRHKLDLYK
ncbi:hypothetical protein [Lentilactobacillus hilgardii]|uniref:hypothetical protein n=1 Tax=Lentilactobacillus hilgardii TaxID=1588 RepID=UPI0021C3B859|nr:hypothetical protein [Lentilactobacillus hilgardii]MCP9333909.1 hypothetical protein [Lentilactobacillus hilgardii]MCP9350508.1 hypothetical protein [Lentilactobacillus hilgardii]MCP9353404.1 hypothetical protein [Lentilactobacillus hilgardii]